ncbi:MAG: hypothetical protein ACRCST_09070 [Turicibacter sp.]
MELKLSHELSKRVKKGDSALQWRLILFAGVIFIVLCSGKIPQSLMVSGMLLVVGCYIALAIFNPIVNLEFYRIVECIQKGNYTKAREKIELLQVRQAPKGILEELENLIDEEIKKYRNA